jgi:hypothetical protein|tara:strand:+ start:284 stop:454 length:171 start_codon:yes stop_codon:yes gene_type:complete
MKVIHAFFCRIENKKYHKGDLYTGSRKDLSLYLEKPKKKAAPKENKKGPKTKIEKK